MDEHNQRKDSATQQVFTNCHFVHNTTNNRQQAAHTFTMISPRLPAYSSFKLLGECDCPTSHSGA
jgi:hypothetical protein